MSNAENNITFIHILQSWIRDTGALLEFYWTKNVPEASSPEEAIREIREKSFIPQCEQDIEHGFFSFILEGFKNKFNEPFVFSLNSDNIAKIYFSKDHNNPFFRVCSKTNFLKAIFTPSVNLYIKKDSITLKAGRSIEAKYVKA